LSSIPRAAVNFVSFFKVDASSMKSSPPFLKWLAMSCWTRVTISMVERM
jgi:hypothetical protein